MSAGAPDMEGHWSPTNLRAIRVLIADDSFAFVQGLTRLLRSEPGIRVIGRAGSGQHAVRLTRRLHPDVVLMDIAMPGLDGIEAARAICTEFPSVSVIGLSSFARESEHANAIQKAGAVAYLCKRTDGDMGGLVIAAIRRCVEVRNGHPETDRPEVG
jgi:DNA-binding NarL/FixJ family response regulator